jgi:outer membrane protein insertion porin family
MTCDERPISPAPRMVPAGRQTTMPAARASAFSAAGRKLRADASSPAPAARTRTPRRIGAFRAIGLASITALLLLTAVPPLVQAQLDKFPEGTIAKIEFDGNNSIPSEKITHKLLSRVGDPLSHDKVEADLKSLMKTKWFSEVTWYVEEAAPKSGKYVLIFAVREMTLLTKVEFRGRKALRLKELEETTGLKVGNRANPMDAQLAAGRILRLYQDKGYDLASVALLEGGKPGDTKIVFEIFEGPKVKIGSIDFRGNSFASDATLQTHITARKPILGLFGRYHREILDEDRQKLIDYYHANGFFEAQVSAVTRFGSTPGKFDLTFVISEGTQYTVRDVVIEGNHRIKTEALRKELELHSGKPFKMAVRDADKNRMMIQYGEIGCIDATIDCEPRFTNQLGVVDLIYKIDERQPYTLGELEIVGNERTMDKVIRREAVQAGLLPGEILDKNRIEIFRRRLMMTGLFSNPQQNKQIKIEIVRKRPSDQPYGDLIMPLLEDVKQARMQDPGSGADLLPAPLPAPAAGAPGTSSEPNGPGLLPFGAGNTFNPPVNLPPLDVPAPAPPMVPGGRMPAPANPAPPPIGVGEMPGTDPSIPGMNMTSVGPDRNDPFLNRSFADIVTSVEEATTGALMFSVGANSFQGLMGNIQINERNFNIMRFPRSFSDIFAGNAFRGGGQTFQINLQAGNWINMMVVSLREPYLFDLPIGASGSGFLMSRIYPNWDERRGGGQFSLGRQFGTSIYADTSVRAEEVDFFGYRSPAPANYLAASGYTSLFSIKPSLRFDNRNSPTMATKGQYLQFSAEQGWGSFTWSKFDVEGRAYFPTGSRPDGTGKRFFTLRSHFGIATETTPVYERYFAGNFGSLRGFQYRTVSPHVFSVPTGGVMMALGSVEYQFPWNARDTFHQIFFTDFGTVTGNYEFSSMRVSVGTGLKVALPIFPVPLEFDLAFPVLKAQGDRVQFFNFAASAMW